MARKKKETKQETNTNVKNVNVTDSTSSLSYHGNVLIQHQKNGKTVKTTMVKNKGLRNLFNYIACSLSGVLNDGLYPKFIVCANKITPESPTTNMNICSKVVSQRSSTIEVVEDEMNVDEDIYISTHTFLISVLNISTTSQNVIDRLILVPNNSTAIEIFNKSTVTNDELQKYGCAYIDLTENSVINISTDIDIDSAVVVTWKMSIDDIQS